MAIEKMKFVNISGLLTKFDDVLKNVVADSEFHLEDANNIFSKVADLQRFDDTNMYGILNNKINEIFLILDMCPTYSRNKITEIDIANCNKYLDSLTLLIKEKSDYLEKINQQLIEDAEIADELSYFIDCNINMYNFFHLNHIKFRFGSMPSFNYKKIELYLGDINAVIIPLKISDTDAVVMYFVSPFFEDSVDDTFKKLLFRRIRISDRVVGTPKHALEIIQEEIINLRAEINLKCEEYIEYKNGLIGRLDELYSSIKYNYEIFSIRKKVAKGERSFHLTGFLPIDTAEKLQQQLENDETTIIETIDPKSVSDLSPPTKLKNIAIFKPFELLVNLFSLPAYNEMDPTAFMGVVYSLLFGIMFADLGQGLVLSVVGFLLYKIKKNELGGILAVAGLFSAFFGVMFGSVFGNEEILSPILMNPMKNALTMNETLLGAIGIGFILIVLAMVFNLINAIKTKKVEELFTNKGFAGLVFYFSGGVIAVISALKGHYVASVVVTVLLLILPLLLIFFKEPLINIIKKKKEKLDGGYYAESFFEIFESLLSYITNTMSFVRVGAFALNHIGMMTVVYVLAETSGDIGRFTIIVFGNILVMAVEGLIVGIQVLRLMFYELFSRFYTGGGRPYDPFKVNK